MTMEIYFLVAVMQINYNWLKIKEVMKILDRIYENRICKPNDIEIYIHIYIYIIWYQMIIFN